MDNPNYGFRIAWSDEDQAFVATCVELEGLSGLGATAEQALSEAKLAVELALEEYAEQGVPFPPSQKLPEYSGQFRLRLPRTLHAQLAACAEADGVSLNTLVLTHLAYSLGDVGARAHACKTFASTIAELQNAFAFQALVGAGIPRVANSQVAPDSPPFDTTVIGNGGVLWQN